MTLRRPSRWHGFVHREVITITPRKVLHYAEERKNTLLYNNGTVPIYLAPDLGSCNLLGFPLNPGVPIEFNRILGDGLNMEVWAVSTLPDQDLRIIETVSDKYDLVAVEL